MFKPSKPGNLIVLKLDGEIWECAPGWGNDENSVGCVRPVPVNSTDQSDVNARALGITHRQGSYGGVPCHEIRQLRG